MTKMDDAREASRQRDLLKKPAADDLSRQLAKGPTPRPRVIRGTWPDCPECGPSSFSSLHWDSYRGLWTHRCGFTATTEELEA